MTTKHGAVLSQVSDHRTDGDLCVATRDVELGDAVVVSTCRGLTTPRLLA